MNANPKRVARGVLLAVIILLLVMTFVERRWEGLVVAAVLILQFAVWHLMIKSRRHPSARQKSPEESVTPANPNSRRT
jgi:xanthine/uracil/vitamin C permease (AzgA family)